MGGQPGPHWAKDDIVIKIGNDVTIVVSKFDVTTWVLNSDGTYQTTVARRGQ